ncbi:2860_t:CDS:2 [Ambispora gerdemannii]|uniref:2860_t:CDS:1 n=1 Tax=Ambispora gerdemannii TaxID=144530 RepID=A0A9N9A4S7_9GLOM|nr:2860_t:CDS:2 [Ambispora gerdemannii]
MPPKRAVSTSTTEKVIGKKVKRGISNESNNAKESRNANNASSLASPSPSTVTDTTSQKEKLSFIGNCVMWFRTDLRLKDNRALSLASKHATKQNKNLFALYIISPQEWKAHDVAPIRVDFWLRNLVSLQDKLEELNIPLIVRTVNLRRNVPSTVIEYCKAVNVSHLFANIEYEINESRRDKKVCSLAEHSDIVVSLEHDQCIIPPGLVLTKQQKPYTVYTPFKKSWLAIVGSGPKYLELSPNPAPNNELIREQYASGFNTKIPEFVEGFQILTAQSKRASTEFPAGEDAAHQRLQTFISGRIENYKEARNIPSIDGTSSLSAYFAAGVISARQCVVAARAANKNKLQCGNIGITTWIEEIAWRDFYRHVLVAFPYVCMNRPYKLETENIEWNNDPARLRRWCEGKTGYPIVDAGMRQLNETGWMHNRVRMITAMFLTKDLLVNWQDGERYFMQHLIDGDFASNNGGWQWCASTGTDAQPWFRIFNPTLQSQKFDPNGDYIRKWVPELSSLGPNEIHDPSGSLSPKRFAKLKYTTPIVDHKTAREKTLEIYKAVTKGGGASSGGTKTYKLN